MKTHLSRLLSGAIAATLIVCAAAPRTALAQPPEGTYLQIHAFTGDEGSYPEGRLLPLPDGSLVGTAESGGAFGPGTVYVLKPGSRSIEVLHSFGGEAEDGMYPTAGVIADGQGNLWGTTHEGGARDFGTIYRISSGTYQTVHSFGNDPGDPLPGPGRYPSSKLTLARDGMLYGTTSTGGFPGGQGTVFRLEADNSITNLWVFGEERPNEPSSPSSRLLQASDGLLYGVSNRGGAKYRGAIFSLAPDGSGHRILHSFSCPRSGCVLRGGLIEASDGHLYGTTAEGGAGRFGTIYRIDRDGSNFAVVHSFSARDGGGGPCGELVETSPGVFVGTTLAGGKGNKEHTGTVFRMLANGEVTVLHQFLGYERAGGYVDGYYPDTTLTLVNGKTLFGVTAKGGVNYAGTVFKLSAP